MFAKTNLTVAAAIAMFGVAAAYPGSGLIGKNPEPTACHMVNHINETEFSGTETRPALCQTQGEGAWTFALDTSELSVPTFNSENMWAGLTSHAAYIIYDNNCVPHGVFSPGDNCGSPYIIEASFLTDVLTIKTVDTDPAGANFDFVYGNGEFSIGNNHCTCGDLTPDSDPRVETGCKCAFPVDGVLGSN